MLYPLDKLESAEKIASSFSYREPLSLRAARACRHQKSIKSAKDTQKKSPLAGGLCGICALTEVKRDRHALP